jgi:hypothetical protein
MAKQDSQSVHLLEHIPNIQSPPKLLSIQNANPHRVVRHHLSRTLTASAWRRVLEDPLATIPSSLWLLSCVQIDTKPAYPTRVVGKQACSAGLVGNDTAVWFLVFSSTIRGLQGCETPWQKSFLTNSFPFSIP